ncbi:MAG: ribonuclease Z [Sedimentibacter sp.]|uniref:ribonuclease Z n=1 Tax=Sedimentibacter sp. TaxID=1960295 RepID=UPI00315949F0
MIEVTLTGTSGMIPLPGRFLSSCVIDYNGRKILIDCGEGTQVSLHKGKISISKIDAILITHCHADHVTGLPGLLLTIGNSGRTEPLHIIGPRGSTRILNTLLVVCGYLPYEVIMSEVHDSKVSTFEEIGLNITSIPLKHHMNCVGYSMELSLKPHFNPDKAKNLNVPLNLWRTLHDGKSVEVENDVITPDMVLEGARKPIKISYVTDTRPVPLIKKIVSGSDLFICEGMYGEDSQLENAAEKLHMTYSEAARIASEANVKELWLTHFSPSMSNPSEFIGYAKTIFPNTYVGRDHMSKTLKPEN